MSAAATQAETPILAFFTEAHSGPARRMESLIAQLGHKERGRVRVKRVDISRMPALAEKLGVATVPTLLLIRNKRVVARLEGRVSGPRIAQMLDERLEPAVA